MSRTSRIAVFAGLPLVFAAVIAVSLTMGQGGQSNPKGTLAVLFAIIGVYVFLVLFLQARDLRRSARDAAVPPDALASAGVPVDDPFAVDEPRLWTSLAIGPIGEEAISARAQGWGMAKSSHRTAVIVTALIFIFVPTAYLTERYELILVGAALIGAIAIVKAITVVGVGGARSRVEVRVSAPEFIARTGGGQVRTRGESAPPAVEAALTRIPAASDWKNLTVTGGPDGIVVERKRVGADGGRLWMADLWLAERLADAVDGGAVERGGR